MISLAFLAKGANLHSLECQNTVAKFISGAQDRFKRIDRHLIILSRDVAIVKEWQLKILPKTRNYFKNDKTNHYFDIRPNSLNKISEKIKD